MLDKLLCKVIHKKVITLEDIMCKTGEILFYTGIPTLAIVCSYLGYEKYKIDGLTGNIVLLAGVMFSTMTAATLFDVLYTIYDKYKNTEIAHCPRYKESEEK